MYDDEMIWDIVKEDMRLGALDSGESEEEGVKRFDELPEFAKELLYELTERTIRAMTSLGYLEKQK